MEINSKGKNGSQVVEPNNHAGKKGNNNYQIPFGSIIPFLIIAFGIAWTILGLFIYLPDKMIAIFGEISGEHPLFFLAVYSPAIAAISIILYKTGIKGFKNYLSRVLIWRTSFSWYVFLFLGIPVIFFAGSYIRGNLFSEPFPFSSFSAIFFATFLAIIKGPIEEFGWRGMALPLLQRKFSPLWAAIILGIIWGIWHLPAFFLGGTQQSNWAILPFFFGCIALSVIVTPLFNSSRGSILLTAFFHFMVMNPIFPDAEPYDTYILIAVAVLIVWINRKMMLNKNGSVKRVIPEFK